LLENKKKNEHGVLEAKVRTIGPFTQQSESPCWNGPLYKADRQWVTKNKRSVQRLEKNAE
jgi:hypothetical protein